MSRARLLRVFISDEREGRDLTLVMARRAMLVEDRRNVSREDRVARSIDRRGKKQRKHYTLIYCSSRHNIPHAMSEKQRPHYFHPLACWGTTCSNIREIKKVAA